MDTLITAIKALSDKTKLRILKILMERDELCVCEIMQALAISQTRASRNLGILKNAGFITDRREGLWVYYSINTNAANPYHKPLAGLIRKWLNDDATIEEDRKRLAKAVKLSKTCPCS